MLKGIAACISPALLQVLSEMGCGDTLVLAGANFPAAACAKETILLRADGVGTLPLLEGILKLLPLDENVPNPVQLVERTSADGDLPVYKIRGQLKYKVEDIERYVVGQLRPVYRTVYAQRQPRTKAKSAGAGGCGYVPGMKVV